MAEQPSSPHNTISGAATSLISGLLAIIGFLVLVGWMFNLLFLTSVVPGLVPMNPTTAALFMVAACALWLSLSRNASSQRASITCAALIAGVGALRIAAYVLGWHVGIDAFLFSQKLLTVAHAPNRMAPNTALNFMLLGAALLMLNWSSRWRLATFFARLLSLISMLSSALAVFGYINGVASLYGFASFIPMAVHTAAGFVLLSVGVLSRTSEIERFSSLSSPASSRALKSKIAAGFGAAVCMLIVISVVAYQSIHQFISNTKWDEHTRQVLLAIGDLSSTFKDLETSTRGYVISGDGQHLVPFNASAEALLPKMEALRALTTDNDSQQRRLDELALLVKDRLACAHEIIESRRSSGFQAAQEQMERDNVKNRSDRANEVLAEMRAEESELLRERAAAQKSSADRTVVLIYAWGAFSFVIISLAGWKISRDIGGRAVAEAALRESEERIRGLIDSAKEYGILTLDLEGRIQTWNIGAERIKGYRAEEIIGSHFSRFYPKEDALRGKPAQELRYAIERGQYEEDGWRVRKDGSLFWANVLITCLRDASGNPIGFSKFTRDLTDRMRAAEQTQNFFTLSLDLLCICGIDGFFKHLNPAWEATFGFTDGELKAKPYLDFIHPDDRAATMASAKSLDDGKMVVNFENRYRCRDGSYRWLTWNAAVSSDRQLIYAAARDITDQKRSDEAIAALNANLRRGNAQLEAANKELEAFSYSVSHDLRAPLRGIDGFSQALLEDYGDRLDETGKDYLHRVRAGTQRMGQLIDDMLNLSRVTRTEMRPEPVDLSATAMAVIEELQRAQPDRKTEVQIAAGIIAYADPRMLRVVLDNLIGNAWKFTSKRSDPRIEIGVKRSGEVMEYFVRDNGAGFDMAYAHKLFGAFQRLHAATDFSGTGIGLATVQRVIHRHGGRIWAEGAVDQGATFYFTLPATSWALEHAA